MAEEEKEVQETPEGTPPELTTQEEFSKGIAEEIKGKEKEEKPSVPSPEEEKEEEEESEEKLEASEEEEEEEIDWKVKGKEFEEKLEKLEKELAGEREKNVKEEKPEFVPEEPTEEIAAYFEDNPVAKDAFEHLLKNEIQKNFGEIFGASNIEELRQQVSNLNEFLDDVNFTVNFDLIVSGGYLDESKGEWIAGHPDARQIAISPEWKEWITKKTEKDKSYAEPESPRKAIKIISEFKEDMAKKAAKEHDKKAKAKAEKTKETIEEPVKPGKKGAAAPEKTSEDDYIGSIHEYMEGI
jgi:hypothetical protein